MIECRVLMKEAELTFLAQTSCLEVQKEEKVGHGVNGGQGRVL